MISMDPLEEVDPAIASLIRKDLERQNSHIHLIASENFASPAVMAASGSVFTNKYAEGYPGRRYYEGCQVVDEMEQLAIDRAKELFGAEHANVQPHSGAQANMGAYFSLIEPGDTVLGMRLDQGGHLTHGSPVNFSGLYYNFVAYGVDPETELIDMDQVEMLAKQHQPKILLAGYTAYSGILDYERFRSIANEVGAIFMVDAAHFIGLVAGGSYPSPVPHADVVTGTTHKALRGPRGGLILSKEEFASQINKAVFPNAQGGPIESQIAAKAVCFHEASQPEFCEYTDQIVKNAAAMAEATMDDGVRVVSGGYQEPHVSDRPEVGRRGSHREGSGQDARFDRDHPQLQHGPRRSAAAFPGIRAPCGHTVNDHPGNERGRGTRSRSSHHRVPSGPRR